MMRYYTGDRVSPQGLECLLSTDCPVPSPSSLLTPISDRRNNKEACSAMQFNAASAVAIRGVGCTQIADCEQFLVIMIFVSSYSLSCPSVTTLTTNYDALDT